MNIVLSAVEVGNFDGMLHGLFVLLIIGLVLGIFYYAVNNAPFITGIFKTVLLWLIMGVGCLVLINFLLSLIGHPFVQI